MLPALAGEMDHVTAVLLVLTTLAENVCVWFAYSVAELGLTPLTATGGESVIVAEADAAVFATLTAVTDTVCCAEIVAGAV